MQAETCTGCAADLSRASEGTPCPNCGSTGREVARVVTDRLNVGVQLGTPTIRMRAHFFLVWARIAFRHATIAREAAEEAQRIGSQGEGLGSALERELNEGLVAVCAASFAFDALYGELKPMVVPQALETDWNRERKGRSYRVSETLDRALDLGGDARGWSEEIRELFDLRNSAVHFVGEFQEPIPHATGTNVAPEMGKYSADQASRFTNLLVEVLGTAATKPKAPVAKWAGDMEAGIRLLLDEYAR